MNNLELVTYTGLVLYVGFWLGYACEGARLTKVVNHLRAENERLRKVVEQTLHAKQCNAPYGQMEKMPTVYELKRVLGKEIETTISVKISRY